MTERCFSLLLVGNALWCLFFSIYDCKVTAKLSLVKSFCAKFSKQLVDLPIIVAKYKRQRLLAFAVLSHRHVVDAR